MYHELNDMELLRLLKGSDDGAFNEIYNRYQGLLYVYACRISKETQEAEDMVQEVFIYLWDKRASIQCNSTLAAYLYSAVRYKFFDRLDQQKIRADYRASLQKFLNEEDHCTDHYLRERELARLIEKGIAALPAKMQEVFALSRKEELSHKEIAVQLNLSEKTVKNQVYNALKILKTRIGLFGWLLLMLRS